MRGPSAHGSTSQFSAAVQVLPPTAFLSPPVQSLPSSAYLTNLPAVSQQGTAVNPGSPGTCEAQSFGYGLGSYTAPRQPNGSPKWNPALAQNSVSPAYLFAVALTTDDDASCPKRGAALRYPSQLVTFGAPTRARVIYQPSCSYLEAIENQPNFPEDYPEMQRFQIGSYAVFRIFKNPAAVQMVKEYLANGQAVAFSGSVLCGYCNATPLFNGVIYETAIVPNSGHGQVVVGYDDDVGMLGNTGALLVQNSFGTNWPPAASGPSPAPRGWSFGPITPSRRPRGWGLSNIRARLARPLGPGFLAEVTFRWPPSHARFNGHRTARRSRPI